MKMKKKYKVLLAILIILLLTGVGFVVYKKVFTKEKEENPVTNTTKVTNEIEGYGYTLDDRDSELFTGLFKELKKLLEDETKPENYKEEYAKYLAKLFVVDLYTINNKVTKYDIGGLEYLYDGAKNSFRSKVLDTIYKTVEDDSYETRKQELPSVDQIEVESVKEASYQMEGTNYNAYEVALSWNYEKNLGYDNSGTITMIEKEDKLYIVSYEPQKR